MTVFLRVLGLLLTLPFRRSTKITETGTVVLHAMPHEVGFGNMHHHIYLQMMEVGRWAVILQSTGFRETISVLRNGWTPAVASLLIRYRRPVGRFKAFELRTRLVCWDEKDCFVEQTFERRGEVLARSVSRYRFPGGRKTKSPAEIFRAQWGVESPPVPEWVTQWRATEEAVAPHVPAVEMRSP